MSNLATNPVNLNDEEEVKQWLEDIQVEYHYGCFKENDSDCCYRFASYMESIRNDFQKAADTYKHCCETYGNPMCCFKLGQFYQMGRGKLDKDDLKAARCYQQACDTKPTEDKAKNMGIGNACGSFALMLMARHENREKIVDTLKEENPDFDVKETILDSFKQSCKLGSVTGCNLLSQFYMSGFPIAGKTHGEKDYASSRKWAERACEMGSVQACNNLAVMYSRGDGVEQDFEKQKFFESKRDEFTKGSFSMGFGQK